MPEITLETLKVTHRRKGVIILESRGKILLEGYFISGTWAWLPLEGYMGKGAHQIHFFWRKNHLFPNVGLGKERSYFHHGVPEWEMPESLWISTPGGGWMCGDRWCMCTRDLKWEPKESEVHSSTSHSCTGTGLFSRHSSLFREEAQSGLIWARHLRLCRASVPQWHHVTSRSRGSRRLIRSGSQLTWMWV